MTQQEFATAVAKGIASSPQWKAIEVLARQEQAKAKQRMAAAEAEQRRRYAMEFAESSRQLDAQTRRTDALLAELRRDALVSEVREAMAQNETREAQEPLPDHGSRAAADRAVDLATREGITYQEARDRALDQAGQRQRMQAGSGQAAPEVKTAYVGSDRFPLLAPNPGESQDEFMSRFQANKRMQGRYRTRYEMETNAYQSYRSYGKPVRNASADRPEDARTNEYPPAPVPKEGENWASYFGRVMKDFNLGSIQAAWERARGYRVIDGSSTFLFTGSLPLDEQARQRMGSAVR